MRTLHRIAMLAITALGGTMGAAACTAERAERAERAAPPISQEQFGSLRWLEGRWVGSGGGYAAFYEEYRFINDSTIEQKEIADSTFARANTTSQIVRRAGVAGKQGGTGWETLITEVVGDTVHFRPTAEGRRGYTWIRVSADHWRAILETDNAPVVYELRRHRSP